MPNKTEISNDALSILGATPIMSMEDQTNEAYLCRTYIDQARRYVLRRKPWKCALRPMSLAPVVGSTPAPGYSYVFDFPANCLRLYKVGEDYGGNTYRIFGRQFHYNANAVDIEYVHDIAEGDMDEGLAAVVAAKLATMIGPRLTNSTGNTELAYQVYEKRRRDAAFDDSAEEPKRNEEWSGWLESRGSFRDKDPGTD